MFEFWPVYSGERFRASGPSCYLNAYYIRSQTSIYVISGQFPNYKTVFGTIFSKPDNSVRSHLRLHLRESVKNWDRLFKASLA